MLSKFNGPIAGVGIVMILAGAGDALFSLFGPGIQILGPLVNNTAVSPWAVRGGLVAVGVIVALIGAARNR